MCLSTFLAGKVTFEKGSQAPLWRSFEIPSGEPLLQAKCSLTQRSLFQAVNMATFHTQSPLWEDA